MKKLSIFESSIIGFLIGVVVSAYLAFIESNNAFVGQILNWLSLHPLLKYIDLSDGKLLIVSFILTIIAFTIYGSIIGLIIKNLNKSSFIIIPLILLLFVGIFFEQKSGVGMTIESKEIVYSPAAIIKSIPETPKQYFGNEALGDLNADGKDDIAFIINRKDDERGMLYYLTSAISSNIGRTGTNLIFLGDKAIPQTISINDGIINIDYTLGKSATSSKFYAQIINGNLERIATTTIKSI